MKFILNEKDKARIIDSDLNIIGKKIDDIIEIDGELFKITGASTDTGNFHSKNLHFKIPKKCRVIKNKIRRRVLSYGIYLTDKTVAVNLVKVL